MHRYATMRFVIPTDDESTWQSIGWTPNMVDKRWPIRWMKPGEYLAFGPQSPCYQQSTIDWMHDAAQRGDSFAPLQVTPREESRP